MQKTRKQYNYIVYILYSSKSAICYGISLLFLCFLCLHLSHWLVIVESWWGHRCILAIESVVSGHRFTRGHAFVLINYLLVR
jgi:hypothetical protein